MKTAFEIKEFVEIASKVTGVDLYLIEEIIYGKHHYVIKHIKPLKGINENVVSIRPVIINGELSEYYIYTWDLSESEWRVFDYFLSDKHSEIILVIASQVLKPLIECLLKH